MMKKLMLAVAMLVATTGYAMAEVDVNKADAGALGGIKGIGPKTSKAIIDERSKGGPFKDWSDFERRVKGIKDKSAHKLSAAGLTVGGKPIDAADSRVAAAPKTDTKKGAATAK